MIQRVITVSGGRCPHHAITGARCPRPGHRDGQQRSSRYAAAMSSPSDFEARLAALETRIEEVAADAAAARHLAAARDRDLADLTVKVDANRSAINALGVQTAARFDQVNQRFDQVDQRFDRLDSEMRTGFAEMRGTLDQTNAGLQQIVDLLTRRDDQ